jgi:hypothetical protein
MAIEDQLQDRYGAATTADDAKRLAQAVKTIFEKVETEFGAQAGYIPARAMTNAVSAHLAKAEKLLGRARFACILIDTMPPMWNPMLKASFVYALTPLLKDVLEG